MTIPTAAPSAASARSSTEVSLKQLKQRFLARLSALGIPEWELIVAPMRKPRKGVVGYYSHMSQFRSKPRVVVNVADIQDCYISRGVVEEEILLTIAHEYGHLIAEALAHVNGGRWDCGHFTVPDWKVEFNGDEEEFAEDFARFCITYDAHHEAFWDQFVPVYGADVRRIFQVTETTR